MAKNWILGLGSVLLFPCLLAAQDTPRSYISLDYGAGYSLKDFGKSDNFIARRMGIAESFNLSAVYFINKFGVAFSYDELNHGIGHPQSVTFEGRAYKAGEDLRSLSLNSFMIGPHYGYRAGRFQWDARLLFGMVNIQGPKMRWYHGNRELMQDYGGKSVSGFSLGLKGAYSITNVTSIGLNVGYFQTIPVNNMGNIITHKITTERENQPDIIERELKPTTYSHEQTFAYLKVNLSLRVQLISGCD